MADLLTLENATNLIMLCFLQAVLGFDNLLYISIESQRAPVAQQKQVRMWGILIAVGLRVVLLFTMIQLLGWLSEPFFIMEWEGVLEGGVNFATIIFVLGGIFIMYTAVKEIGHMLSMDKLDHDVDGKSSKSATQVVLLIVVMNLIFSFDSVLSALAITDVFPILATAIILSGIAMLVLADGVTRFLEKNRMYEVLGLFILLIVGVVLLGEAGPAAAHAMHDDTLQIKVWGQDIIPMSKSTFYFSVVVLVAVEIIQSGYSRKLNAERAALQKHS
ncbi:TerC family protein [Yoonia sediminilitoris]|uniref:Putative tellurium resistance membrane protein TerC n=1 Tax=Yoonia sediminilitoris TaxID=1286148 RepID=A0A2T6KPZ8_9RHOB|nr:TerC family protein [Yoonia sediminilitoris]PUB18632.1 putative tellurium resistance membrane protein TerC [Yoonia sediminilitoris]RCW98800.1 putative tellurium resistance membrane protein TerC [Yoonia sediminilitoris]